jgi:hypothetical protein
MWSVTVCIVPRATQERPTDWVYSDMDEALGRFMREVEATVKFVIGEAPAVGPMVGMYQEFVIDKEETEAAFRNYLSGDADMCIPPALVLKEMVEMPGYLWLHTLARIEGESE